MSTTQCVVQDLYFHLICHYIIICVCTELYCKSLSVQFSTNALNCNIGTSELSDMYLCLRAEGMYDIYISGKRWHKAQVPVINMLCHELLMLTIALLDSASLASQTHIFLFAHTKRKKWVWLARIRLCIYYVLKLTNCIFCLVYLLAIQEQRNVIMKLF